MDTTEIFITVGVMFALAVWLYSRMVKAQIAAEEKHRKLIEQLREANEAERQRRILREQANKARAEMERSERKSLPEVRPMTPLKTSIARTSSNTVTPSRRVVTDDNSSTDVATIMLLNSLSNDTSPSYSSSYSSSSNDDSSSRSSYSSSSSSSYDSGSSYSSSSSDSSSSSSSSDW